MSVLKARRTTSKAEYVNTANQIYVETLNFLTRMSARYSRLLAEPVAKLAGEVVDHAEKANSIFPSDAQRIELRKAHLLEARASLKALDVRLTHCYLVIMQNPEGGFTTSKGNSVSPKEASENVSLVFSPPLAAWWWLRSANYNNNNNFCNVNTDGSANNNNARNAAALAPGFCDAGSHGVTDR